MVALANSFSARGFAVDLIVVSAHGPFRKDVSPEVHLVDFKVGRVIKALFPLSRHLRRTRPQALLSAMGHANVVALLARMLARVSVRVVVSERGFISGEQAIAKSMVAKLNYYLLRLLYPSADGICAVSQAASRDLCDFARLPVSRVQTIYNPFDLPLIAHLAAEPLVHPWFEIKEIPVIISIGRLNEAKNFDVLIRAFAELRKQRAVRLVILGEGELRGILNNLLSELGLDNSAVSMPGFVTNPYAWLARCSLFVLSSRREGLPGALIEAMACGVPVVSTNCLSGPAEILEGGRWGRLVPVGDENALAQAMAEVLDTPSADLPDVRRRAADFEQEAAVDAYLDLLGLPRGIRH